LQNRSVQPAEPFKKSRIQGTSPEARYHVHVVRGDRRRRALLQPWASRPASGRRSTVASSGWRRRWASNFPECSLSGPARSWMSPPFRASDERERRTWRSPGNLEHCYAT